MTIFIILWALATVYTISRLIVMMSWEGKVSNEDRVMVFFALTPFSLVMGPLFILIEGGFLLSEAYLKWKNSPERTARRIEKSIRKRRRGPLLWAVETLHKRRGDRENAAAKNVS